MIVDPQPQAGMAPCDDLRRTREVVRAGLAHDLGNHLQIIASAVNLIERTTADPALAPFIRGALDAVERASALSREIFAAQRTPDAGMPRLSLPRCLADLEGAVALAAGPGILIDYRIDADIPDVTCDRCGLENALINLVTNASRAMAGAGRITIALGRRDAAGGPASVILHVADTGCGMPAAFAAHAFEPYVTGNRDRGGTGLGLAMVDTFARASGGSASLVSRPGRGTIVTLQLPGLMKAATARR